MLYDSDLCVGCKECQLACKDRLNTLIPDVDVSAVVEAMRHDKKVRADRVRFVLLRSIGHTMVSDDVDLSVVEEVLRGWG